MRVPAAADQVRDPLRLVPTFLRWSFVRGFTARGYWLAASIYLVLVADLTPAELILEGAAQSAAVLVAEVPAGVFADTVSRKGSLVLAAGISGTGMTMTGLVTSFPALVLSQMLWGLGWAFVSGADVAWFTDELERPDLIDRLLAVRARWELLGAVVGVVVFGLIAVATSLAASVVVSGLTMLGLGLYVAARFPEVRFRPARAGDRWRQAALTLRSGIRLARRDQTILLILLAWLLVNGSAAGYGRLVEARVIDTGITSTTQAIAWFGSLTVAVLVVSAVALRTLERTIDGPDAARRAYRICCTAGVVGLVAFATTTDRRLALAAVLLASPAVHPGAVLRAVSEIWINRRTSSAVRATVHSLSSQAEQLGEVVFGGLVALLAHATSTTTSIAASATLLASALLVATRAGRRPEVPGSPGPSRPLSP